MSRRSSWIWPSQPVSSASRLLRHRSTGQTSCDGGKHKALQPDRPQPRSNAEKGQHTLPASYQLQALGSILGDFRSHVEQERGEGRQGPQRQQDGVGCMAAKGRDSVVALGEGKTAAALAKQQGPEIQSALLNHHRAFFRVGIAACFCAYEKV